jgi:hypothetical protein
VPEALAASKILKRFFRLRILSKSGFATQFIYRKRQRKKLKSSQFENLQKSMFPHFLRGLICKYI